MKNPLAQFEDDEAAFVMAPMIDMVFLLLVFFMCASHLSTVQSVPMKIPTATRAVVPRERPDRYVVNITRDGTIYGTNREMSLDELREAVREHKQILPNLKIYLRADQRTPHKHVRRVMTGLSELGLDHYIFGTFIPNE